MKISVDVDVFTDVEEEGITHEVYLQDDCEPSFASVNTWEEIIERNVGFYIIPYDGSICPEDLKILKKKVKGLKRAVKLFENRIKNFS